MAAISPITGHYYVLPILYGMKNNNQINVLLCQSKLFGRHVVNHLIPGVLQHE
jgi:hypothetical protein